MANIRLLLVSQADELARLHQIEYSGIHARVDHVHNAEDAQRALSACRYQLLVLDSDAFVMKDLAEQLSKLDELPPAVLVLNARQTLDAHQLPSRLQVLQVLAGPLKEDKLRRTLQLLPDMALRGEMVAVDQATRQVLQLAARVASRNVTVMLKGESGTGKEMVARYLHAVSPRSQGRFVAVNCAAIPENMLEAMLFGYEKGAFTGALRTMPGKFEQAQGGTLLLDEISEMDLSLQAKLLRVIQEREVERLGSQQTIKLDVRIVATTNRDLKAMVREGRFREDLYYRLHVFPLAIPPLRQRSDDIIPLAKSFLGKHGLLGDSPMQLTHEARLKLKAYHWPGNVRELENVIQRAQILALGGLIDEGSIVFDDESEMSPGINASGGVAQSSGDSNTLNEDVRQQEWRLILDALNKEGGQRKATAARLGISERTLRYKLARMKDEGFHIAT